MASVSTRYSDTRFPIISYLSNMTATKILVLGSGMVARPCVEYLVRNPKNQVTIGEHPCSNHE